MKFLDLTGRRFGYLSVVFRAPKNINGKPAWVCRCSCGKGVVVAGSSLRQGLTKSCGCLRSLSLKNRWNHSRENLIGQVFGKLKVIKFVGIVEHKAVWLCKCECGEVKSVLARSLKAGLTTSCGCFHKAKVSSMFSNRTDHVGTNNPNYKHNKTDEERQDDRTFSGYREWRNLVFKRDDYNCSRCGKHGGSLHAYHIEDYSNNPDLRIVVSNGTTLCEECHRKFHRIYGIKRNTRYQFNNFLGAQEV